MLRFNSFLYSFRQFHVKFIPNILGSITADDQASVVQFRIWICSFCSSRICICELKVADRLVPLCFHSSPCWETFNSIRNKLNTQSTFRKWLENHTKPLNNSKMIWSGFITTAGPFMGMTVKYKRQLNSSFNVWTVKWKTLKHAANAIKMLANMDCKNRL